LDNLAERLHSIDEFGVLTLDVALLARLHVGGQRLATLFDHAGKIPGELLEIEGWGSLLGGIHGGPRYVRICSTSGHVERKIPFRYDKSMRSVPHRPFSWSEGLVNHLRSHLALDIH